MHMNPGKVAAFLIALLLGGALAVWLVPSNQAQGQGKVEGGAARYSVVETEAHNLIVTDNKTNTLYFYTIDKDAEIGSELKLRGSIDLNQVGKSGIVPTVTKKKAGGAP